MSKNKFWTIEEAQYRDKICTVLLAKSLLDNGRRRTQDGWVKYSNKARQNNKFYTPDTPLVHAISKAAYNQRNDSRKKREIEEIRPFLQQTLRQYEFITLTRIRYQPKNQSERSDEVIHNYNQNNQVTIRQNIAGPNGKITKIDKKVLKAIFEDDNPQEINSIYRWINGTDCYLWRINSREDQI
ncbi:MAG: hypothetical protein AABX08_00405 [Nanoarchaeota archaeon]